MLDEDDTRCAQAIGRAASHVTDPKAQERIAKTLIRWTFARNITYTICGSAVFAFLIFTCGQSGSC